MMIPLVLPQSKYLKMIVIGHADSLKHICISLHWLEFVAKKKESARAAFTQHVVPHAQSKENCATTTVILQLL